MLSKEEIEKAKEMLNKLKNYKVLVGGGFVEILTEEEKEAIETLLQHIDQLEEYLERISKELDNVATDQILIAIKELKQENNKQNKIIDEMAKWLIGFTFSDEKESEGIFCSTEEVKQYFEKKVNENVK